MRAEQGGSLSYLNYMNISKMICMITHMNISMDDHVPLRITSFLSCALFISGTQQIIDEGKQWGGGAERVYEQV